MRRTVNIHRQLSVTAADISTPANLNWIFLLAMHADLADRNAFQPKIEEDNYTTCNGFTNNAV
ncbi:MAG: hypothetical protein VYE18_02530, partial [Pseudomonadota bacterium]|nr:hypothetical protein [Pseudomonadota bacterium]